MENEELRKPFDVVSAVERRLSEFDSRIKEAEEKTRKSFVTIQEYLELRDDINRFLMVFITGIVGAYIEPHGRKPSDLDPMISSLLNVDYCVRKIKEMSLIPPPLEMEQAFSLLLTISKIWQLPFDDVASYLTVRLGKDFAKSRIKKEVILQHYGSDALRTWDLL